MPEEGDFDLRLFTALAALREEARHADGSPIAARAAMHRAVSDAAMVRRRRSWRVRNGLKLRLIVAGAVGAAGAGVLVGGWSASAGSPLHVVQEVRENLSLGLAGSNRLALLLNYADQRLSQWRTATDPAACLAEARMFLSEAEALLPTDATATAYLRWNADEAATAADEQELAQRQADGSVAAPAGSTPTSAGPGHAASGRQPGPNGSQGTPGPDGRQGSGDGSDSHHEPSPSDRPRSSPSPDHEQGHSPSPSPTPHGD